MSDNLQSSRIEALFESALHDYEKQTGIPLAEHPLAEQLQNCRSVDNIATLLQEQARAFNDFRDGDKIMKSLKSIVSALSRVSAVAAVGHNIGVSFPHAHAIHTGLGILLTAFKGVRADFDALVDFLESIELFLNRLDIYTKVTPTPAMNEIVVKIMVEVLSTIALVTKQIRQGRPKKFVKKLFGENDVEAVLQRLDRLTQEEARTTAAQTLEVVYELFQSMRVVIDDGKASADNVRNVLEFIQEMASEMNKSKRDKLQQDILTWLSPPDPWKNHNLARGSRHTGTAAWFVDGGTLSEWKSSSSSSLLWVHGKPGAGKSVLCSTIIENVESMRKSGLASLAFFYCDFRDDKKRDLRGLLSSVLVQLCLQSDSYCQILSNFYSEHANGSRDPGDDELMRCLRSILNVPGQAPVYLILDGLDECSNAPDMPSPRENILMFLDNLIESKIPNLRICVTSRPEVDIKVALEPLAFRCVSLHDESEQRMDIENYIKSVVNSDPNMRRWKAVDKELVIDVLIKRSDGMFRWVYCQIAYLRRCLPGRIRHALDELPETLDATYDRALRDIDKANWEFVYRLLQCVAVASRPLRVAELAEILSFDFKTKSIPKFREGWRPEDPLNAILSTTSSLLTIADDKGYRIIQFSHFSVKEFLTSSRLAESNDIICRRYHISMTPAHTLVAQACLGILLHLDETVSSGDRLKDYPLAKYAAEYWVDHAQFEGVSRNVEDGMKQLFDPSNLHLAICLWIYNPLTWRVMPQTWETEMPFQYRGLSLHCAAFWGFHAIVEFLITQHSQDVQLRTFYNELTPLHLASEQGHEDVVHLLLEHDADVTAQDERGRTPLQWALYNGSEKVARLLLEHGADPTARDKDSKTLLLVASEYGNEKVARLLLEHGADSTAKDMIGRTSLYVASYNGHEKVALLLLEHGADSTARDEDGQTPLHIASIYGLETVAILLLEHSADSTARDKYGSTPLHRASQNGHEKVALLILEHGADSTARNKAGWTPLHLASQRGHEKVALLLLEHGAGSTAREECGQTPLHLALRNSHEKVARLLLEHGADSTARDKYGSTPLHQASQNGHEKVALLLLEHGADSTARDEDGQTPLRVASYHGHETVVILLLEHSADSTARDKYGSTPLHRTSQRGHEEVALLLLEHGADSTARDDDGQTPLHVASFYGYVTVVILLLEHSADSTARDKYGSTPLHQASQNGHEEVALLLLEHGADSTARDDDGQTPLHVASFYGHETVAILLLEHSADPTARDKYGSTPLHLASVFGHEKVALLILEHGADSTARNKACLTPLHLASENGHEEVIRVLLEHGADATAQNKTGLTPLYVVVRHGRAEAVSSFLDYRADVTAQREDGSTLLHLASRWGHVDVARFLFKHGMDVTALNKHGWNALHLASRYGHVEVARFLLDHGADPTTENKYGWTPLRLALRGGHVEVARLFEEHGADMAGMDDQVAPPSHVALDREDLGIARMFERDADASHSSDHTTSWPSIIGVVTIIIVTCYVFRAHSVLRK